MQLLQLVKCMSRNEVTSSNEEVKPVALPIAELRLAVSPLVENSVKQGIHNNLLEGFRQKTFLGLAIPNQYC